MNKRLSITLFIPLLIVSTFFYLKGLSLTYSDAADYLVEAHKLSKHGLNALTVGFIERYWKPTVFPLWSSFFFLPVKGSFAWGSALTLLSAFAVFISSLYFLFKKTIPKASLPLTLLVALQSPLLSGYVHFMSEAWALSFWVLSFTLFYTQKENQLWLSGLALGIAAMMSPVLTLLYGLPFLFYILFKEAKKQKVYILFNLWPFAISLCYFVLFFQNKQPKFIWLFLCLFFIFLPLLFKTCPKKVYLFFSLSLTLPLSWFAFDLPMLWDWIYLSSFSTYAQETGKFSLLRFKEYQGYFDVIPLSLATIWLIILLLQILEVLQKTKKILLYSFWVFFPVFLAFVLSANGDLRYFKWPFFLLLVGLLLINWNNFTPLKQRLSIALLSLGSLLSVTYLFQADNTRLSLIKEIHQELLKILPDEAQVGLIPLGTENNDLLQSRAIYLLYSYQREKKHNFNFLDERKPEEWNKKDVLVIGPCEQGKKIDPSLPASSKLYSSFCPQIHDANYFHFVVIKNEVPYTQLTIKVLKPSLLSIL